MNDRQRARLNSYRAVVSVLDRYPDDVAAVGALERSAAWVRRQTTALAEATQNQADYAPQSGSKQALRTALTDAAVPVAQALAARADEAGDASSADLYDFERSDFLYGPEQDALDRAGIVLTDARAADPADLDAYGVTPDDLTRLDAAYDAFEAALPASRDAIAARRTHTAVVERLVPAIGEHLRCRTDRLMTRYRGTPFGDEYRTARTIVGD